MRSSSTPKLGTGQSVVAGQHKCAPVACSEQCGDSDPPLTGLSLSPLRMRHGATAWGCRGHLQEGARSRQWWAGVAPPWGNPTQPPIR